MWSPAASVTLSLSINPIVKVSSGINLGNLTFLETSVLYLDLLTNLLDVQHVCLVLHKRDVFDIHIVNFPDLLFWSIVAVIAYDTYSLLDTVGLVISMKIFLLDVL